MAQQGSEASVASSSPTPYWWPEIHANPLSSWHAISRWPPQHPHAANSSEDDISASAASFAIASNHSGPSMDSSSVDLSGEPSENHLWSQVLLSVGSDGDLQNRRGDGENFLESLSSKSLGAEMFDPACDYLKKLDGSWEFTNPSPFNILEKQLNRYNGSLIEHERLANLSDLVSNWSIAPPNPQVDHHVTPPTCNASVNPSMAAPYLMTDISHIKHELPNTPPSYTASGMVLDRDMGYTPYFHEMKGENQNHEMVRPFSTNGIGYQIGHNDSGIGRNKFSSTGVIDVPWSNTRNFSDLISFNGCLSKPSLEFQASKPSLKGSDSSDNKKQGYENSSSTKGSGRGNGSTEGKKKRSEDGSEAQIKKPKHESPTVSSLKMQAPKVKLGDRITALQQIVSPFGKTDTASVLLEAINYIRFLQEQVQLLSDPYMKSSTNKDHNSWGGLERKDKMEQKIDLRSRGLCLVPISFTPQVYRENTGPDYWTPTYRGCLYR